ncbi:MAG: DUF2062 domain-containing protein [Chthoniobacterales bacterium]
MVPLPLTCIVKITELSNKIVGFFRKEIHKVLELKDSQHAIAGGVAIGIFCGFTPLFGLKTLLSIAFAWLFGVNMIAAAVAVSLHDIIIVFTPLLLRWEYQLGFWVLHQHFPPPMKFHHNGFKWSEVWYVVHHPLSSRWWASFYQMGLPVLLGSLFFGIPVGFASYGVTLGILNARKKALQKRDDRAIKQD